MKILFGIDYLDRGGTELQLKGLIDRLDRSRIEPSLLTIRPYLEDLVPTDCPHLAWDVPKLGSAAGLKALRELVGFLKRERFDAVHCFFIDTTIFLGLAARLAGVPLRIGSFRDMGYWRKHGSDRLYRWACGMMTHWVANSCEVRRQFLQEYGLAADRFGVIYNGMDPDVLEWVEHPGPTRNIGIVGNLNRRVKRADLFIEAAGRVARNHPDITWHVLGDGEYRGEYEAQALRCGLEGKIVFTGRIDHVTEYLGNLQIGVNCSDSEGFSNALLEYMFRGCAAVATSVGGNPEAVIHEKTGLLVPPGDAGALARAIGRLVDDTDLRRQICRRARTRADREFGWNRCVARHEDLYLHGTLADPTVGKEESHDADS